LENSESLSFGGAYLTYHERERIPAVERRKSLATAVRPWFSGKVEWAAARRKILSPLPGLMLRDDSDHGLACGFALSRSRFAQPWL